MTKRNFKSGKGKYYKSCSEMPLYSFIKVLTSGDKSLMGKGSPVQLEEAWQTILNEFSAIASEATQGSVLAIVKNISMSNNNLKIIELIAEPLKRSYDPALCDSINQMGYDYKYNEQTKEQDLNLIIDAIKAAVVDLDKPSTQHSDPNPSSYYSLLSDLSNFIGDSIDDKTISLFRFVELMNKYNLSKYN
ncbi:hypothetical protein WG906_09780 [Pedobacter sp. P351]|uniref:hypothetical protein n=1 Tax=Pedobacter superstes TaxID=3133441 RepID=UPI00309F6E0E